MMVGGTFLCNWKQSQFRPIPFEHIYKKINMLHIIGLGLADERDISVKGLEIVKKAERVYLEAYTAVLLVDQSVLVRNYL